MTEILDACDIKRQKELLVKEEQKLEEESFKEVINSKNNFIQKMSEHIPNHKRKPPTFQIGVRCPGCGCLFSTYKVKGVTCPNCHRSFQIYYDNQKSRIVRVIKGTKQDVINEAYMQGIFKKKNYW